jgi:hypothetical protein
VVGWAVESQVYVETILGYWAAVPLPLRTGVRSSGFAS